MLRPKVTVKNLDQLVRESSRGSDRERYLTRLYAEMQVEDPQCAYVAKVLADNACGQLIPQREITAKELHRTIIDACMVIARIRYLAEEQAASEHAVETTLMEDPENSSHQDVFKACDESRELLKKFTKGKKGPGKKP